MLSRPQLRTLAVLPIEALIRLNEIEEQKKALIKMRDQAEEMIRALDAEEREIIWGMRQVGVFDGGAERTTSEG